MFICRIISRSLKPIKVIDFQRQNRVGLAAKSVKALTKKAAVKFQISPKDVKFVLSDDGTVIDDDEYFHELPDHTELMVLGPDQTWNADTSGVNTLMSDLSLRLELAGIENELAEFIRTPQGGALLDGVVRHFQAATENANVDASSRIDHPAWFEGLPQRYKSKEEYMAEKGR